MRLHSPPPHGGEYILWEKPRKSGLFRVAFYGSRWLSMVALYE